MFDIMSLLARVYPNSTAERDAPAVLAPAPEGGSVPLTINFDGMALALELAALRTSNERASRREFALVSPNSVQDTALGVPSRCNTLALPCWGYHRRCILHPQNAERIQKKGAEVRPGSPVARECL